MKYLSTFSKFSWLWNTKMEEELKKFNGTNPQLEDYENKLKEFEGYAQEIDAIEPSHQLGALSLKTDHVKTALKDWIQQWKRRYSKDLYKKAHAMLESLNDDIKQIQLKIDKPATEVDSLGSVMQALEEIRKK
jgi:dynein heavy chain